MQNSDKSGKKPIEEMEAMRPYKAKLERAGRNATKHSKAEEALRGPKELYRAVMENAYFLFTMIDVNYKILMVNSAVSRSFHKPASELIGRECFREFEKRESICSHCPGRRAMATGQPAEAETKGVRDDGSHFSVRIQAFPTIEPDGNVTGFIEIIEDITERKKAEQTLQKERDKAQKYLDVAAVMLVAIDAEQRVGLINRKGCEILGYSEDEILGKNWFDNFLPERIRGDVKKIFDKVLGGQADRPEYYENLVLTKNGDERLMAWHNTILRDDKSNIIAILSSGADITERKKAEEKLRRSKKQASAAIEAARGFTFNYDIATGKINWGGAIEEITGYTPEEFVEVDVDGWAERIHPDDKDRVLSILQEAIEKKDRATAEYRFKTKKGYVTLSSISLTERENGKAVRLVGILQDITERKRAGEALRESEEKYRTLTESSLTGIFIHQEGKYVFLNDRFAKMHGYKAKELLGKEYLSLIHPDEREIVTQLVSKRLAGKKVRRRYEVQRLKKNGETIWCEMMADRIEYRGKPAIMGNIIDITERKGAEEEVVNLSKFPSENPNPVLRISSKGTILYKNEATDVLLNESGLAEEDIFRILPDNLKKLISKALKTKKVFYDLEVVVGDKVYSYSLFPVVESQYVNLYAVDVTERKKAKKRLLDHQTQLKSLASQLTLAEERERHRIASGLHDQISQSLASSKIELDALRHRVSPKDPGKALKEVSDSIGKAIDDMRSLTFDLSYPILYELGFEAAVATWLADRIEEKHGIATEFEDDGQPKPLDEDVCIFLFRDVRELLTNVVKHAQAKKAKVSIRRVGRQIQVSIEDDGIGFDPKKVATTAVRKGGFGLFSIRERLEQLGGHLEIESAPGCGTKATLIAPLKQEKVDKGEKR